MSNLEQNYHSTVLFKRGSTPESCSIAGCPAKEICRQGVLTAIAKNIHNTAMDRLDVMRQAHQDHIQELVSGEGSERTDAMHEISPLIFQEKLTATKLAESQQELDQLLANKVAICRDLGCEAVENCA